jgi:hypothetical protein
LILIHSVTLFAFGARTIEVTKDVDVQKDLLAKQLADLKSYKEIFPAFVKSVYVDSDTGRAKFIVETPNRSEADVQSTILPDGTFVVEILSGDLKGTKITTALKERTGFDGTPNGATTITTRLNLETSWTVSLGLSVVRDDKISDAIGNGLYDLGQYVKKQNEPVVQNGAVQNNVAQTPAENVPRLEAARELEPQMEIMRIPFAIYQKAEELFATLKGLLSL